MSHTRRQVAAITALRPLLDQAFPPNGPCAFCGDTLLGARHRVIDAIAERIRAGDPWEDVVEDMGEGYTAEHAVLALAVSW